DNPSPSAVGASYTVAVPVTGSGGSPSGTVSVSDGVDTCPITLNGSGAGSCGLASSTAGSKTLTASYAGNATYAAASGTATHTVSKATPTVTITSDTPDPAAVGASYTVAYTVAGP